MTQESPEEKGMIGSRTWVLGMIMVLLSLFQAMAFGAMGTDGQIRLDEDDYHMRMNVTSAPISFHGSSEGSNFGSSISGEADVNGDGLNDLLIGSPWDDQNGSSSGRVDIFLGGRDLNGGGVDSSRSDVTFLGMAIMDQAGMSLGMVGDLNGDGIDDIVICDYHSYYSSCKGSAKVFLGRPSWPRNMSLEEQDLLLIADSSCPTAHLRVARCGDVNDDGFDDIFLSNMDADANGCTDSGKVYIIFGGRDIWNVTRPLEDADSSIKGADMVDYLGSSISGLGDINRDGFDDIIIGAQGVNYGNPDSGRTYVFFGRSNGFGKNTSCDSADVLFNGEDAYSFSGGSVSGGKDINGDGLNDIVIGAPFYSSSSGYYPTGKVYIIFGKYGPWPKNIDLSDADASYIGELNGDYLGMCLDLTGDMDGDGISELLIASPYSKCGGYYLGQAYLIKGRASGWANDENISSVSFASFIGENSYDYCGMTLAGIGDIDMDGGPDIAISSPYNDHFAYNGGSVYIFPGIVGFPPKHVTSLELFLDEGMMVPAEIIDRGETVHIRLTGIDSNSSSINSALVNLTLNVSHPVPIRMVLRETGKDTGIYNGKFIVPSNAEWNEELMVWSTIDQSKYDSIRIDTPVRVHPRMETMTIEEGVPLDIAFKNVGWSEDCYWEFQTDSDWIEWSGEDHRMTGTPDNGQIGDWSVTIGLTDGTSHADSITLNVRVKNVPPAITTENVMVAQEDVTYIVDYSCDEDMEGEMEWGLATNASFLEMISDAGILRGTPTNPDVGTYWVRVWVDDGNGGKAVTQFDLTVCNTNDPPTIMTQDITRIDQGIRYSNTYEADDPDIGDVLTWSLDTDAEWLSLNGSTLSGTPGPGDIGTFPVELTVSDLSGSLDQRKFSIEVVNLNDRPIWTTVPSDVSVLNGKTFIFDVNATDDDLDDEVVYTISTTPYTDMVMDRTSGLITWSASIGFFERPPYMMTVKLSATDGTITITHSFKVTVTLSQPPTATLISPTDGTKLPFKGSSLRWSATDPDDDMLTFDVYIGENKALVSLLDESTLFIEDLEGTQMGTEGLQQGKTYFWTVIPSDGSSHGPCSNKVRSFRLNSPPSLKEMDIMQVQAGKEHVFFLKATDNDQEDRTNLRFYIKEGPDGMTMDGMTGMVRWTPTNDQVRLHRTVFAVNDSVESSETVLTIEVMNGDEGNGAGAILLICVTTGIVIVLIAIIIGTMVVIKRMRKQEVTADENINVKFSPEPEKTSKNFCAVALDANEAHMNDQRSKAPKTYEDLYGAPAPEKEEALNTRELRDFIKGSIEELERVPSPEE